MIAAEITGSVGVRQADMARQEIKLSDGKSNSMNPGDVPSAERPRKERNARTSNDEPPYRHRRDDKHQQPSNVFLHVWSRQLDPDREKTNGQHHSHNFKRDYPGLMCPTTRVEESCAIRPNDHPKSRSDDDFAGIQLRSMSSRRFTGVQEKQ